MEKLYTSLVIPHLEFAVPVLSPFGKGDILELEKIQKRAIRIPYGMKSLSSYEERLVCLGLTSLEDRRIRGDLIQLFKFINGLEIVDRNCLPKPAPSQNVLGPASATRGNSMRLVRQTFKSKTRNDFAYFTTVRDHFFSNRVVGEWNDLPNNVIGAPSLNSFKARLDEFLRVK